MNRKFIIAVILLVALVAVVVIFAGSRFEQSQDRVLVSASFYPLADFLSQVGGDRVEVINMTPVGTEPHDFEPSPQDLVRLRESKVFIYSGAGFEPWVERLLPTLRDVITINAGEGIPLMQGISEPGGPGAPLGSKTDPHYYLDPVLAQQVVQTIAGKLAEADPENEDYYRQNATAYSGKLAELDNEFRTGLADCDKKDIVTSHAAFGYLANRYDLRQVPIAGLAEEEPSPAELADIAEFAKKNDIRYIFFERTASPRLAETVAREVGAQTLVLNPIEGLTPDEQEAGKDYIDLMQANLANLRLALECR